VNGKWVSKGQMCVTINWICTKQDYKKCKYKKQKIENEQVEEQMNLGDMKMLGVDEIWAYY